MIRGFRHKGLKHLFEKGDPSGLNSNHARRMKLILLQLQAAVEVKDMAAHGYALHALRGNRKGEWAIKVNANWRITFTFDGKEFDDIDLVDYH